MLQIQRITVGDGERGLLYRNRRFERVLEPRVYWLANVLGRIEVRKVDIEQNACYIGKDIDAVIERLGDRLDETFLLADIGVDEVGLASHNGKLAYALAPGS